MASLASNFGKSRQNPHRRTAVVRRKETDEGVCAKREIVYQKEKFAKDGQPKGEQETEEIIVNDCFLKGLHFIDNNRKDRQVAESLLINRKKPMNIDSTNLPIYIINAHAGDEFFVELVAPEEMGKEQADKEIEFSFDAQIKENFILKRVSDARRSGFATRTNFFKTKADSGIFVIQGAPTGYDAQGCGAENLLRKVIASNPHIARDLLLSPEFSSFLPRLNKSFAQSIYMPPGYSVLNKGYQFWEHSGYSSEPWGILCLSDNSVPEALLKRMPLYYTNLIHKFKALDGTTGEKKKKIDARPIKKIYSSDPKTITDFGPRYTTNYPQLHPNNVGSMDGSSTRHKRMKRIIEAAIKNRQDVSLRTIVETMGPGIYLDMGCASISLKIWDPEGRGKFRNYGPDHKKIMVAASGKRVAVDIDGIQPIYNVIYDDLDIYTHNLKLAWNNIAQLMNEALKEGNKETGENSRTQTLLDASKKYAEQAYNTLYPPTVQTRAEQNTQMYMNKAKRKMNNMAEHNLKLPGMNQLGVLANSLSVAERTKRFRARKKKNVGGRRKKTRRRKKRKKRKTKRRK